MATDTSFQNAAAVEKPRRLSNPKFFFLTLYTADLNNVSPIISKKQHRELKWPIPQKPWTFSAPLSIEGRINPKKNENYIKLTPYFFWFFA